MAWSRSASAAESPAVPCAAPGAGADTMHEATAEASSQGALEDMLRPVATRVLPQAGRKVAGVFCAAQGDPNDLKIDFRSSGCDAIDRTARATRRDLFDES